MSVATERSYYHQPPPGALVEGLGIDYGCIGCWVPNSRGSPIVRDLAGRMGDGALLNMDATTDYIASGRIAGEWALDFDGTNNNALHVPDIAGVHWTEFTLLTWCYLRQTPSAKDADQEIAAKGGHGGGAPFLFWADNAGVDHWAFIITDSDGHSTGSQYSAGIPAAQAWTHLALAFRGGVNTRLYINGAEDGNSPFAHVAVDNINHDGNDWYFGNDGNTAKDQDGKMPVMMLFDRALSEAEVKLHFRQTYSGLLVAKPSMPWESMAAAGVTVTPSVVEMSSSVPTAVATGGATISANALALSASVPAAVATGAAKVIAEALVMSASVPSAAAIGGAVVSPDVLALTASVLGPTVITGAVVAVDPITLTMTVLAVVVGAAEVIPPLHMADLARQQIMVVDLERQHLRISDLGRETLDVDLD